MSDDLDHLAERLSQILATGDVTGSEREFIEGIIDDGWIDPDKFEDPEMLQVGMWGDPEDGMSALQKEVRRAKQIIQNH